MFDITLEDTFRLDTSNRWMKMEKLVPWELAEEKYTHMFRKNGRPAKQIRMALGALIIQQTLSTSDEETVQQIMENPYLQRFIGLKQFTNEAPFHPSLMVWFRKRLSRKFMKEINDAMCREAAAPEEMEPPKDDDDNPHGGTMIVDATCAPADIKYPTDVGLLADAIEKTDAMIDTMQEPLKGIHARPRTYRKKSRKLYVGFVKQRKPTAKAIRKCRGKQLNYLKRNLTAIETMRVEGGKLSPREMDLLSVIWLLYEQQQRMHENRSTRVDDRIVSLSQPHIRPIVRGKAGAATEFGAKVQISVVNGYVFPTHMSYDAFSEGKLLRDAIDDYRERFGLLPKRILADRAYTTRENRAICKALGIELSGKPLGRPSKNALPYDPGTGERNEVEGKFGTLKTCYGWNRVMARLPETGMTAIWVGAFAMNLKRLAQVLLRSFLFFMEKRVCSARLFTA